MTALVCAAGNLAAQTPGTPTAKPETTTPTNSPTETAEVVVSGQLEAGYKPETVSSPKIQGPLRDVPQTITVIPKELIKEQGATSLRDVLRNVPGISIQAGEGGGGPAGDNLSIRGFNAKSDLFIDNVRDFGGYSRDPFNFEQVEVFKGPSSSNAGRGSTGGSINLVSKVPTLSPFYNLDVGGGTDNYFRTTLDINQPLWLSGGTPVPVAPSGKAPVGKNTVAPATSGKPDQGISLRVNGLYHTAETAGRDFVEEERFGGAASLGFFIGPDTTASVSFFHLEQDNQPDYGIPWIPATATNPDGDVVKITPSLRKFVDKAAPVDFHNYYGSTDRDFEDITTNIGTLQLDHKFSDSIRLRNTFRAGKTERDSVITAPRFNGVGTTLNRQFQGRDQEDSILANLTDLTFDFNTGPFKHTLNAGIELSREESENKTRAQKGTFTTDLFHPNPTAPFKGSIDYTGARQEADVDTASAYLFDKIQLSRHFEIQGGARYDHTETDYTSVDDKGKKTSLSREDDEVSWRAALVYKPVENGSIYFSYGTSFNPSTELLVSSSASAVINQFDTDPEENRSYELGTKWDLFDNRLSLTGSLFRTEKTNARTADPTDPTNFELSGEQVVQGVEFGVAGTITDKWRVFAGYTYLDSEIESSKNPAEVGKDVSNTPHHSFNFWTVYDLPYGFQIGAGAQFVGDRFNNNINQREAPSYWVIDGMVGYKINENVALRVNVYNVGDEEYIDRVGGGHFVPGPGRSATLTASVKF